MAQDYTIETENFSYHIEASPIIEDMSFDHEFGTEIMSGCADVKVESAFRRPVDSKVETQISSKQFKEDEAAYKDLLDRVTTDSADGVFDDN